MNSSAAASAKAGAASCSSTAGESTPPDGKPIIKRHLVGWLSRSGLRKNVLAFATARPYDGGGGALYVLLKEKEHPMTQDARRGRIASVNISSQKGEIKHPVPTAEATELGLAVDAHAGPWHRQVTLLAQEEISAWSEKAGKEIASGRVRRKPDHRGDRPDPGPSSGPVPDRPGGVGDNPDRQDLPRTRLRHFRTSRPVPHAHSGNLHPGGQTGPDRGRGGDRVPAAPVQGPGHHPERSGRGRAIPGQDRSPDRRPGDRMAGRRGLAAGGGLLNPARRGRSTGRRPGPGPWTRAATWS